MRRSIFWKIALIILPIVLLINAALLLVAYKQAYDRSYDTCVERMKNGAGIVEEMIGFLDKNEISDGKNVGEALEYFCNQLDLPYIYVFELDPDTSSVHYLAIGFGKEATEEGRKELYKGKKMKITIPEQLLQVYNGQIKNGFDHVKNRFGETLICFTALRGIYDPATGKYDDLSGNPMILGMDLLLDNVNDELQRDFNQIFIYMVVLSILMVFLFAFIIHRMVSKPAKQMSAKMKTFVEDHGQEFKPFPVKGRDEFSEMSRSFNSMVENIHNYMDSIEVLNREKHTRQAELDIAGNIQMGLLGAHEYESDFFRIRARMRPARDVGGDLYDHIALEDGRVFFSVADVAGKGISAALFMSRAVTLLHLYAKMHYSPAEILKMFNDTLSENNPEGLFITTFVAFYDPKTRELTYANGGHNVPYVLSDRLIPLDGARGMAAGLFPGEDYEETSLQLKDGDCVFLYTDGVNEAKNVSDVLYSTERLEKKLSECLEQGGEDPLRFISDDLLKFSEGAEQNDDITILTMRVKAGGVKADEVKADGVKADEAVADADHQTETMHLKADKQELGRIKEKILQIPVDEELQKELYLVAEEIFINICSYAYDVDGNGEAELTIRTGDTIEMIFRDWGKPFDPTKEVVELEEYDYDNSVGGMGRFLVRTIADEFEYEYRDGQNILRVDFHVTQ